LLDVKIDRDEPTLLHDQVAAQIRRAIADGEAKPGERLPPARHLAAVMNVNTNTVLRALRLLRDEGLLELRPRARHPRQRHTATRSAADQGDRARPAQPRQRLQPRRTARHHPAAALATGWPWPSWYLTV
jgi:DNA-binding transcriptional MocR family regulator